ncbi:MAG: IS30 family transposase [Clostridiales bacterium]|nr:IS30 family transposase [Clostridiales bacterium]
MEQKKNKHLTLEDRNEIQQCLDHGMTFKAIAGRIGKDQTTVSKEVKKHLNFTASKVVHRDRNGNELPSPVCPKLLKTPFVCNPCEKKRYSCPFQKQKYIAKLAQQEYETLLVDAREGIALNKEEFYVADQVIANGIQQGQHLYHILQSNHLQMSKSAVYRNLQKGYLSVSAIDFPRVVKFKPRRQKAMEYVPKTAKIGRTYADFLAFTEKNGIPSWVEMDTVIGRIGGKVILTLHFTFCNFMVGILLDNKTAAEAATKFQKLKAAFSSNKVRFARVFPLILTDNGGEFSNISAFECNLDGVKETDLFFCDPMQSCQKPRVEKNHTLFRDIVPKGKSFDGFTQEKVNMIFSHVNSVKRKVLNGKTPYEIFSFTYGSDIAEIFGIKPIPADKVIQSPMLLSR